MLILDAVTLRKLYDGTKYRLIHEATQYTLFLTILPIKDSFRTDNDLILSHTKIIILSSLTRISRFNKIQVLI